jgi:hypothetical protein
MDPRQERKNVVYRRRMWRALAITLLVGIAALLALDAWLDAVALEGMHDPRRALRIAEAASLVISLAFIACCLLLGRLFLVWSRQCREQGQWPPAGVEWPGGRPPRHGEDARRIAMRLKWTGIAAIVVAAGQAAWTAGRWLG